MSLLGNGADVGFALVGRGLLGGGCEFRLRQEFLLEYGVVFGDEALVYLRRFSGVVKLWPAFW